MKIMYIILCILLLWQTYRIQVLKSDKEDLEKENKHLMGQIQKANDQVLEWNSNYLAKDYAKKNGLNDLKLIQ
jgi:hypothetical protein